MADSAKKISAAKKRSAAETQTPSPAPGAAKVTSVPENVAEAINKSNDLVPALFALPCECSGKKLKLCKQVGWVKDGIFTTGYMEINVKEAKTKGLFNQPRRVTVVPKEDSNFQSVPVSGKSNSPSCHQKAMLRRNSSPSTVVIDVKGKLATNLITVQKDREPASEIPGRLVPLNQASPAAPTPCLEVPSAPAPCLDAPAQSFSDAECGRGGAALPKPTLPALPLTSQARLAENDKPTADKGLGDKGTALSTNKNEPEPSTQRNTPQSRTKSSEPEKHSIRKYFLTEDGKIYPSVANPDFSISLSERHATQKLQQLVDIADADRKLEDGAITTRSSSSGRHLTPVEKTDDVTVLANVPANTTDPPVPSAAHDKAGKQNIDGSGHDLDVPFPEALHEEETDSERTETVSPMSSSCPENTDFNLPVLKVNRDSLNEQPVTSSDKDLGIVSSGSNGTPLIGSKSPLKPLAISCPSPKGLEMPATSSEDSTRTDDVEPLMPANIRSRTSGAHSPNCAAQRNRTLDPLSPASNTSSQHTPTGTLGDIDHRNPSNLPALPSLGSSPVRRSDSSPSPKESDEETSDGFPSLRIDSVYSLSEKEAEKLFPKAPPKVPDKPVAPSNVSVHSETTNSPQETNAETKSRFVVTSKTAISNKDLNIDKFPFSNTSNVQLYNVKPIRGASPVTDSTTNKKTFTPAIVAPTSMPKNAFVCIPTTISTTKVPPQVALVPPKQLLTFPPSYLKPNPTMITLVPVKIGSMGVSKCQTTFVPSLLTQSTLKSGCKVTTVVKPATGSRGTQPGPLDNAVPSSSNGIPMSVKISGPVKPSSTDSKCDAVLSLKSPAKTLTVASSHDTQPASRSETLLNQVVSRAGPSAKSQTAVIKVAPTTTTLPPRNSQACAVSNLPFVLTVPGNKQPFIKGVRRQVLPGSQPAPQLAPQPAPQPAPKTSVAVVGGPHETLPKSSSSISNTISSLCTSVPIQAVKMGSDHAPSPAVIDQSREINKGHVATGDSSAKPSGDNGTAPIKLETKVKLSYSKGEPSSSRLKKTFLVTTSNGEKRLVCLPYDDEAATVLSRMASNKVYQFVAPQNAAEEKKSAENKGDVQKKEQEDLLTSQDVTKPKKAKTPHKHDRHDRRAKKKLPLLKIKFMKEPRMEPKSDLRRSVRERKLKRPYSPPSHDVAGVKPARLNSPKASGEETSKSTSDPDSSAVFRLNDTKASGEETTPPTSVPDQPQPRMKTEPTETHPDSEDMGGSLALRPPSPQSFISREDRVRHLKELMKQKEAELEAILKQRQREKMERLADPQLSDL